MVNAPYKSSNLPATNANAGQAGELFVAADLLIRGLAVTKPLNINTPHDLHAKIDGVWRTIQVKSSTYNEGARRTVNSIAWNRVSSDILALVYLPAKSIRYMDVKERTDWHFTNLTAEAASAQPSTDSATPKPSPASSVTSAASNSTCKSRARRRSKPASTGKGTGDSLPNRPAVAEEEGR